MQISWSPHVRPQTPQFFLSVKTLTQVLPQAISPPVHDTDWVTVTPGAAVETGVRSGGRHWPLWQIWPLGQSHPHFPQLSSSVKRFVHLPSQSFWPDGHGPVVGTGVGTGVGVGGVVGVAAGSTKTPSRQIMPYGTENPHFPQLLLSVWRSAHTPEQSVKSLDQEVTAAGLSPLPWAVLLAAATKGSVNPERTTNAPAPATRRTMAITPTITRGGKAPDREGPGKSVTGSGSGAGDAVAAGRDAAGPAVPSCCIRAPQALQNSQPSSTVFPQFVQNGIAPDPPNRFWYTPVVKMRG